MLHVHAAHFRSTTQQLNLSRQLGNMSKASYKPSDVSFSDLADMYISELRRGVELPIDVLVKSFPHLQEQIRTDLPALALLERSVEKRKSPPKVNTSELIGGCRIIRELGRGAMGIVYEAEQLDVGRSVALKIIPLEGNQSAIDRFEIEAKAMGRVDHPNITPVYSYGHDKRFAFIVMKLIHGASIYDVQHGRSDYRLKYWLNEIQKDWNQLAAFGWAIASGLQHAHDRSMVHRDIKPANIILDQAGKVWITDFGLAKIFDHQRSLSRTGDAIGTPRYMAPEQLRGVCDSRSDVYSLGITMYELAAGVNVWNEQAKFHAAADRQDITLTPIQDVCKNIPANLAQVIMKCCEFDPQNRYQSASELQVVLQRFLDGKVNCDRRRNKRLPDHEYHRRSRRQMVLISTGCLSLCMTAGVVWGMARSRNGKSLSEAPRPTVSRSAVNLIDQLADPTNENMLEIVTKYVEESIDETSENLHYSEEAKTKILQQIDKLTSQIKEQGGVTKESLNHFLVKYRETTLPAATRVMRASLLLQPSTLKQHEKVGAIAVLRRFATAVANKYISEEESEARLSALVGRPFSQVTNLEQYRLTDDHLRRWFYHVNARLSQLPPHAFDFSTALEQELGPAVQQAFPGVK